jgi:hypothetical protein
LRGGRAEILTDVAGRGGGVPVEIVSGRGARSSVARAPPHHWDALGTAKREGKAPREAVDMQHQIKRQGRAVACLPVVIFDER